MYSVDEGMYCGCSNHITISKQNKASLDTKWYHTIVCSEYGSIFRDVGGSPGIGVVSTCRRQRSVMGQDTDRW